MTELRAFGSTNMSTATPYMGGNVVNAEFPSVSMSELRRTLQAELLRQPGQWVVFDADGTLWSHDVGVLTWDLALEREALLPEIEPLLEEWARITGGSGRASGDPNRLAALLTERHYQGKISHRAFAELQVYGYAGMMPEELRELAREALREANHSQGIHPQVKALVGDLRSWGARLLVVSASPRWVILEACAELGFEESELVGGVVPEENGKLLPRMAEPLPYGEGKALELRARVGDGQVLAAFGDSDFDLEMMLLAKYPVAIGDKPGLLAGLSKRAEARTLLDP